MPEQTICCTCGNILRVRGASPGDKVTCSRCKKAWTVPAAQAAQVAAARPIGIVAPAGTSSPSGMLYLGIAGAVVAIVVLVVAVVTLSGGGQRRESTRPAGTTADAPLRRVLSADAPAATSTETPAPPPLPASPEPAPVAPPEPVRESPKPAPVPVTQDDPPKRSSGTNFQADLDIHIYRLNTCGLVAEVLDLRGKTGDAADVRNTMRSLEASLKDLLAKMKAEGHTPFVPGYIQPDDTIQTLDKHDFKKLGAVGAEKVLTTFAAALKAGSRARLIVKRAGQPEEFDIIYHERPKEVFAILQRAGIVPGAADPVTGEKPPPMPASKLAPPPLSEGPGPLAVLVKQEKRSAPIERAAASQALCERAERSRAATFLAVAAHYLANDDGKWHITPPVDTLLQGYFDTLKIVEVEQWDAAKHLAAAADLVKRIGDVRSKDPEAVPIFELFAAAHVADASQLGAGVADLSKAADAAGLRRTADQRFWGSVAPVLRLNLGREAVGARVANAASRFESTFRSHADFGVRYIGVYLLLAETLETNKGGFERLVNALRAVGKSGPPSAASHLDTLALSIETLARCDKCQNGRVPCPNCGGDGKRDVKCGNCEGKGKIEKGGGTIMCNQCRGAGTFKGIDCGCARTGNKVDCPACKGKIWLASLANPSLTGVLTLRDCSRCHGSASILDRVAVPCPDCLGLGRIIVPVKDPTKILHR